MRIIYHHRSQENASWCKNDTSFLYMRIICKPLTNHPHLFLQIYSFLLCFGLRGLLVWPAFLGQALLPSGSWCVWTKKSMAKDKKEEEEYRSRYLVIFPTYPFHTWPHSICSCQDKFWQRLPSSQWPDYSFFPSFQILSLLLLL